MTFDEAFEKTLFVEKGFTIDRNDSGNWTGGDVGVGSLKGTKYGISAATFPREDIVNLTVERAKELAKEFYWDKVKCSALPEPIRYDMFDVAYSTGVSRAIKLLQRAVDVKEDGVIGPITIGKANGTTPQVLDKRFNGQFLLFITSLSRKQWDTFGRGWTIRVANRLVED